MVRAFIALELSREIQDNLSRAQETIRGSKARLTLVDPKNIHITIKFLGEVDQETLVKVIAAVRSVRFFPFGITAGPVTVNSPRRPHTVWSTIDDAGQGEQVFSLTEEILAPLGFEREIRRFTPHATIARVKSMDASLFTALNSIRDVTYGSCMIRGLTLKKSTLLPQGPVYENLAEVTW